MLKVDGDILQSALDCRLSGRLVTGGPGLCGLEGPEDCDLGAGLEDSVPMLPRHGPQAPPRLPQPPPKPQSRLPQPPPKLRNNGSGAMDSGAAKGKPAVHSAPLAEGAAIAAPPAAAAGTGGTKLDGNALADALSESRCASRVEASSVSLAAALGVRITACGVHTGTGAIRFCGRLRIGDIEAVRGDRTCDVGACIGGIGDVAIGLIMVGAGAGAGDNAAPSGEPAAAPMRGPLIATSIDRALT